MIADSVLFILIGTILPFDAWNSASYITLPRLVLLGLSIMVLRRIPIVLLMSKFIPDIKTLREALFVGHFGPIATGALYFALTTAQELPADSKIRTTVIPVVMFIIFVSIVVHGCSAPLILLASQIPHRFVRQVLAEEKSAERDGDPGDQQDDAERGQEDADERSPLVGGPAALVPGRVARELADKSQGAISRSRLDTILHKGRSRKKRHAQRSDDPEAARPPPDESDANGGREGDEEDEDEDEDPREPYAGVETKKDRDKRHKKEAARRAQSRPPLSRSRSTRSRSPSPAPSEDSLHELYIYDENHHIIIEFPDGSSVARKVSDD